MVLNNQGPATASTTMRPNITAILRLRLSWASGGAGADLSLSVICPSSLRRIEEHLTAIIEETIARLRVLFTFPGKRGCRRRSICIRQIIRADRRLAVAAGNIEHVIRLAQSGHSPAQGAHQFLPALQRGAQMRGAWREIAVM